jgi:hypothetical protein
MSSIFVHSNFKNPHHFQRNEKTQQTQVIDDLAYHQIGSIKHNVAKGKRSC